LYLKAPDLTQFLFQLVALTGIPGKLQDDDPNPAANIFINFMESKSRLDDMGILCQGLLGESGLLDAVGDQ